MIFLRRFRREQIEEARSAKEQSLAERPEVERLARSLKREGKKNHFAIRTRRAMRGET